MRDFFFEHLRRICAELRPSLLDHGGLEEALQENVQQFSLRTNISVQTTFPQTGERWLKDFQTITDNGVGLLTMRERAEFIGGQFSIESEPGRGTRITVVLPRGRGGQDHMSSMNFSASLSDA